MPERLGVFLDITIVEEHWKRMEREVHVRHVDRQKVVALLESNVSIENFVE